MSVKTHRNQITFDISDEAMDGLKARQNGHGSPNMAVKALVYESLGLPQPLSFAEQNVARAKLLSFAATADRERVNAILSLIDEIKAGK